MELYDYTESYAGYFWQWEERGEVIAIPNGSTIAYLNHITEILEGIKDSGAPPFGSLLLVLIALNPEPGAAIQSVHNILGPKRKNDQALEDACAFMRLLTQMPLQYKEGAGKMELLRALFKNGHNNVRAKTINRIAHALAGKNYTIDRLILQKPYNDAVCYKDFRVLALLCAKLKTVEDIKRRIAGLPDAELPDLELDETDNEPEYEDFVAELTDNYKTFHVGSLIRRIWSGLNIPFHNVLPSEQPMGGVSDLTNKGDFHRLLITEFANDDIVFLSRLANNEALYLNREIPPQSNNIERVILIDVSIKNWGTPKAIAYALMLAIARHPKTDIRCSVFVVGEEYYPVSYETIDGLIEALPILEGCLHPGPGLRKFFSGYENAKNMEVIFITNPDTINSPGMVMDLQDYQSYFKYWLIADHEGNIDVYKRQQKGKKHHQHLRLPLEELWQKPPSEKKKNRRQKTDVPENRTPMGNADYPILFPGGSASKKILRTDDGAIFRIGRDKSVYRLHFGPAKNMYEKGWEMVHQQIPRAANKFSIGHLDTGEYMLLAYSTAQAKIFLINLNSGEQQEADFRYKEFFRAPEFYFDQGQFHLMGRSKRHTFLNGKSIEVKEIPEWPDEEKIKLYQERQKIMTSNDALARTGKGFLKNVNTVFITEEGGLVINTNELILYGEQYCKWYPSWNIKPFRSAYRHSHGNEWIFADGSKVLVTESGMIILEGKNAPGIKVFIPTTVEGFVALATATEFCGDNYYLPEHHSLKVKSPELFFRDHITPFMDSIKNHAANH